jgi:hypothetical protein
LHWGTACVLKELMAGDKPIEVGKGQDHGR